jgi:hypothetical protein
MTLGSGAVTSVCALAILITVNIQVFLELIYFGLTRFLKYVALPNSFVWIALFFLLGRCVYLIVIPCAQVLIYVQYISIRSSWRSTSAQPYETATLKRNL